MADKKALKVIKKAEADQIRKLRDAGKAEIKFLKAEGASKQEIANEKAANKVEVSSAKSTLAADGYQRVPQYENGLILSDVGTYQDTYAPAVQSKINQAVGLLSEYNIPQLSTQVKDDATIETGMSLNNAYAIAAAREAGIPIDGDSLKSQFGDYVSGANRQAKIFNAVDQFASDEAITAADFSKKLKPVKGQENVFTSKIGGNTTGVFKFNPETNTYEYMSATPVKVTVDEGGFFSSPLGSLLVGIAGGLLVPGVGGLLATGSWGGLAGAGATLGSSLAAGGLIGAGTSAITGGDILTGGLLGAVGGGAGFGIGQAGGLGNVLKGAGLGLSDDLVGSLNRLVSGFGTPTQQNAQLAADVLSASGIPTTADDILAATARETIETGTGGLTLSPSQIEDFLPSPVGGGTIMQPPVVPGSGLVNTGTGAGFNPNSMGSGFNINPEDFIQTPIGGGTMPPVGSTTVGIDSYITPPAGAGTLPVVQNPNPNLQTSVVQDLVNNANNIGQQVVDFVTENPLTSLAAAAAVAGGDNQPVDNGPGRLPDWVTDPSRSKMLRLIPQIQNMQYPNYQVDFSNLFQRGGGGAGQFLGYDLLNMLGDIPAEAMTSLV